MAHYKYLCGVIALPENSRAGGLVPKLSASLLWSLLTLTGLAVSAEPGGEGNSVDAVRVEVGPVVDGRLDDPAWDFPFSSVAFTQIQPTQGGVSDHRTILAIVYDASALYVAVHCLDQPEGNVVAQVTRRDGELTIDDTITLYLDTFHDGRSCYYFTANALGTQADGRVAEEGKARDVNWDAHWLAQASVDGDGWTVEFRIPFSIIKYARDGDRWGFNLRRTVSRTEEHSFWSGYLDEEFRVSQYGDVTGLESLPSRFQFTVRPAATGTYRPGADIAPFDRFERNFGLDVRLSPSSESNLDLTFNPDFAQVEADREQVNLTRYELFLPEKRPFFLEGAERFSNRIRTFYSRRIRDINAGARYVGTHGPYKVAALGVDAAKLSDLPWTDYDESEPAARFSAVRLQRNVHESSTAGMMLVTKDWENGSNRSLDFDYSLFLPRQVRSTAQFILNWYGTQRPTRAWFWRLSRNTHLSNYHIRFQEIGKGYKIGGNTAGYINDDDRLEVDSDYERTFWVRGNLVQRITAVARHNFFWGHDGPLRSRAFRYNLNTLFIGNILLSLQNTSEYKLFDKAYNNRHSRFIVIFNATEWTGFDFSINNGINFDAAFNQANFFYRLKYRDRLVFTFGGDKYWFESGAGRDDTLLGMTGARYNFTPDIYLDAFGQYNSATNRKYLKLLFAWRYRIPESVLYVAYERGVGQVGLPGAAPPLLFIKIAYGFGN
jgi:hypothetical protein